MHLAEPSSSFSLAHVGHGVSHSPSHLSIMLPLISVVLLFFPYTLVEILLSGERSRSWIYGFDFLEVCWTIVVTVAV